MTPNASSRTSDTSPMDADGVDAPGADPRIDGPHAAHWPPGVPATLDTGAETLWDGFAARAVREPDSAGLHFLGRSWTWRELVGTAERLAGALQSLGVNPGDRVLLFMQNCPQFILAFHAVVRAGGVVVPVNPMNKADELGHYISDAQARVAVASSDIATELARADAGLPGSERLRALVVFDLADALPPQPAPADAGWPPAWQSWLPVRHGLPALTDGRVQAWNTLLATAPSPAPVALAADALVLLPYTSGTTGLPKGCEHTHATLLHNALAAGPWLDLGPGDVQLVVVPMFHITGLVMGMIASIRNGASIVLLPRWDRGQAAQAIARHRVTHWPNIPTMVIDLLAAPDLDAYDLGSLRFIGGGGAAMPEAVAVRLGEQFGLHYVEGYGLTETAAPTHQNPRQAPKRQCLGIPYVSTRARVVDPVTLAPLPVGEVGEILVSGPQVFHGYWRQNRATADAFVTLDGHRFFRTGDLGRMDAQGYYFMADRLKRMINASGFKVWPAEVEALLHKHPAVQEACIIALRDPYRGESAKAVIVLRPEARGHTREADIIGWAREHMAVYKVPRSVEFVEQLPRSGSGKVLWRVLQARQDEAAAAGGAPVTPPGTASAPESAPSNG